MIHQTYQGFPLLSEDFFDGAVHNGSLVDVVKVVDEGTDSNGGEQVHCNLVWGVVGCNELNCCNMSNDQCQTNQAYGTHLLVLESECKMIKVHWIEQYRDEHRKSTYM